MVLKARSDSVGVSVIGAGFIGRVHAKCVADNPRTRLATVHDVDGSASAALAAAHGAVVAASLEDALTDPATDMVIIATPTDTHGEVARACIEAGKPFLCEKPVDVTAASACETHASARSAGLLAGVAFNRRFDQQHATLKRLVDDGEVGRIEMMLFTSRTQSPPAIDYVSRSGGQFRDKGSHFFDLACWISGDRPVEVFATGDCLIDPRYAEHGDVDTAMLILKMGHGGFCHMNFSRRTAYGYDERIEVVGSDGMALSRAPIPVDVALYRGETIRQHGLHHSWYPRIRDSYPAQLDAFVDALAGTAPFPSLLDGLVAEAIADAAEQSLEENRPLPITYAFVPREEAP